MNKKHKLWRRDSLLGLVLALAPPMLCIIKALAISITAGRF